MTYLFIWVLFIFIGIGTPALARPIPLFPVFYALFFNHSGAGVRIPREVMTVTKNSSNLRGVKHTAFYFFPQGWFHSYGPSLRSLPYYCDICLTPLICPVIWGDMLPLAFIPVIIGEPNPKWKGRGDI